MYLKSFSSILLLCSALLSANAWWDEVHIIIGEIAKSRMTPEAIQKLESYLNRYEYNYPLFGSITNATTWPDYVRCGPPPDGRCNALPFTDNLSLFNGWHYNDMARLAPGYENPPNHVLPGQYFFTTTGANWALNACIRYFNFQKDFKCSDLVCNLQPGNDFSWNITLRLLLHIYGDFHNPCHNGSGVNANMPNGDNGCTGLQMTGFFEGFNLHQYTDNVGDTLVRFMPNIGPDSVVEKAKMYMEKYPFTEEVYGKDFFTRSAFDIEGISAESHDLHGEIYSHFDFPNFNPATDKIDFNQTSKDELQAMLEKRFVLAGYRLSEVLNLAAESFPDFDLSQFPQITPIEDVCIGGCIEPPACPQLVQNQIEFPETANQSVVNVITLVLVAIVAGMMMFMTFVRSGKSSSGAMA